MVSLILAIQVDVNCVSELEMRQVSDETTFIIYGLRCLDSKNLTLNLLGLSCPFFQD